MRARSRTNEHIKNKKVLITGATRGIGLSLAKLFFSSGAYVIGTKTEKSEQNNFCKDWIQADFSVREEIIGCAEEVKRLSPDIVINNAGVNKIDSFVDIDPQDFLKVQQINVFAPFSLCQAALPSMKKNGWGRILNISSIWGIIGKEYRASYMASKFAIDGITLAIAAEYSKDGILANCLSPGFTDTQLTRKILGREGIYQLTEHIPIKRMAKTDEIAELAFWLCGEKNTYVSGQNIPIDGGFSRV